MQKAPILKGSGLMPLEETKSSEEVHVFGKNLEERVITHKEDEKPPQVSFSASQSYQDQSENDIESIKKRKFDAITGEEDEETVFQGDFKLFVWDVESSNWIEKGRGQLRLNDSIEDRTTKSRLIMRISGTLRIILNVAIRQSGFKIIASSKTNIRFTDSLTVWAVSGSNAQQLRDSIEERLVKSGYDTKDETANDPLKKPKSDPLADGETLGDADSEKSTSPENTKDHENSPDSENVKRIDGTHEKNKSHNNTLEEDDPKNDTNEEDESQGDLHEENESLQDGAKEVATEEDKH